MSVLITPDWIIWGTNHPDIHLKFILNLPPDTISYKIRLRNKDVAKCFVKTPSGVTEWILAKHGEDDLELKLCQGENGSWIKNPSPITPPDRKE